MSAAPPPDQDAIDKEEARLMRLVNRSANRANMTKEEAEKAHLDDIERRKQELAKKAKISQIDLNPTPSVKPVQSVKLNLGETEKCLICGKSVYANEKIQLKIYEVVHSGCFRCTTCNKPLDKGAFETDVRNGKFFCGPHFKSRDQLVAISQLQEEKQTQGIQREGSFLRQLSNDSVGDPSKKDTRSLYKELVGNDEAEQLREEARQRKEVEEAKRKKRGR